MTEIIVAGLAFLGTVIGSGLGVLAANKLTNYRIAELEKKVDKHNNVIERLYKLEKAFEKHTELYEYKVDELEKGV